MHRVELGSADALLVVDADERNAVSPSEDKAMADVDAGAEVSGVIRSSDEVGSDRSRSPIETFVDEGGGTSGEADGAALSVGTVTVEAVVAEFGEPTEAVGKVIVSVIVA